MLWMTKVIKQKEINYIKPVILDLGRCNYCFWWVLVATHWRNRNPTTATMADRWY